MTRYIDAGTILVSRTDDPRTDATDNRSDIERAAEERMKLRTSVAYKDPSQTGLPPSFYAKPDPMARRSPTNDQAALREYARSQGSTSRTPELDQTASEDAMRQRSQNAWRTPSTEGQE